MTLMLASGFMFPNSETPDYRLLRQLRDVTNTANIVIKAIGLDGLKLSHQKILPTQPLRVKTHFISRLKYYLFNGLNSEIM